MDLQQLLSSLTPDIYQNLKRAVELGKWPDGNRLSSEQRQLCMQAMIAYEQNNLLPEQQTGYIEPEPHMQCGTDDDHTHDDQPKPLKWL